MAATWGTQAGDSRKEGAAFVKEIGAGDPEGVGRGQREDVPGGPGRNTSQEMPLASDAE